MKTATGLMSGTAISNCKCLNSWALFDINLALQNKQAVQHHPKAQTGKLVNDKEYVDWNTCTNATSTGVTHINENLQ
jgi:hypothetical protein